MLFDHHIHHHLKPTAVQRDNLVELAQHLIRCSALLRLGKLLVFSENEALRVPLEPVDVVEGRRMPPMMPLAHGPLAGVPARPHESWSDYGERAFCMPYGSLLEAWLQRPHWALTDPTPIGAGLRIAHALEFGVPDNWERISYGADTSDYPYGSSAWQRLGLDDWPESTGRDELAVEWEQMRWVTLPPSSRR